MNVPEIRRWLARYGARPLRQLGQNFLVEPRYLEQIVAAADLRPGEVVLEIGPGLGSLTGPLLATGAVVTAVEVDRRFIEILQERFDGEPGLRLVEGDILELPVTPLLAAAEGRPYKVVANIPYYITSAVVRHLLESDRQPERIVLLVQKEVAQRIIAAPGALSLLAIGVQFYGVPEIVATVPAGAFYPAPKVDSAILRIRPHPTPRYAVAEPERFWRIVRAGFGQKRKQLRNALDGGLPEMDRDAVAAALERAAIDHRRRAQSLTIDEWVALYGAFGAGGTGS